MSADDDTPLAPWAQALLDQERPIPALDPEAVARLRARVDAGIDADGAGIDASGAPPGGASPPATASVGAGHSLHLGSVLLGLGAGLTLGVAGTVLFFAGSPTTEADPPPAPATPVPDDSAEAEAPSASPIGSDPTADPSRPAAEAAEAAEAPARDLSAAPPSIADTPRAAPRPESSLERERRLLDAVRGALRVNDIAGALGTLDRHQARYPTGILAEERDALRIRALLAGGRLDEASERLQTFRARYPQSLSLPALEARARQAPVSNRTPP